MSLLSETQQRTAPDASPGVRPAPADHVLNSQNAARYAGQVVQGVNAVTATISRTRRPFTGITPDALHAEVSTVDLDEPLADATAALAEVERLYLRDAVYFHDVKYAAHLNCPVVIPALVGEAVLSAVNSSMDTWDQSAGATLMEQHLIRWTADRLGLGSDADGVFTSGGSQSNLQALLIARNHAYEGICAEQPGSPLTLAQALPRLRVFTSDVSHFSIGKSASILGLGYDAVVSVPVDADKRMDAGALRAAVRECRDAGLVPMAVVATAGTTDFGSIDPLASVAELCRAAGIWMHVDAAYGGGLITSPRNRDLLAGIDGADSVTIDYHKTFFQPVSSSAVLVRDASMLAHVTHYADYLNPRSAAILEIPNQVDKSIQTTRRFDALKLWLTLRTMGADGIGALLDDVIDLAARTWRMLHDAPDFDVVVFPAMSTLVFRYVPLRLAGADFTDRMNLYIRQAIFASGEAVIAGTTVDGRHFLKFTLLNAQTTLDDLHDIVDLIRAHGDVFVVAGLEDADV